MRIPTVVIGAGQAGLALSRHLTDAGQDHVLLERGRVAERWRSERPDSFRLLTPNWLNGLPGTPYRGPDPDGFMDRDQVVHWFDTYAASFDAPVHTGVTVTGVAPGADGTWRVDTDRGPWDADRVVVATGHMAHPSVPAIADGLPSHVLQLHSRDYRRPDQLPDGRVVVVGAGPSGQQIADELALAGRDVVLAAGGHKTLPRRYRGHDAFWWMHWLGMLDRTVDSLADPRQAATERSSVLQGGVDDLDLHRLHRHGVRVTGRLLGVHDGRARLGVGLAADLAAADAHGRRLRSRVDELVRRTGLDVPAEPWPASGAPAWASAAPRHLDLGDVSAVVWATGYRRDWSWIHAPVVDRDGELVHRRGVTPAPGLYVLGLRWLHRRDSAFIGGVGRDAAHLAQVMARTPVGVRA